MANPGKREVGRVIALCLPEAGAAGIHVARKEEALRMLSGMLKE